MIGRVLLAALLAGIAAGLIMAAIQHVRLTPMIVAAERFETSGHDHDHAATGEAAEAEAPAHDHGEGWAPADGWQRTLSTTVTAMLSGAAFAILLAAVSLVSGLAITRRNGIVWGLCGFIAVSLAPAAGLAPELPGMPAGDLAARQVWWLGTIAATGIGLYLIAARREAWALPLAVVLIVLPHLIGAPAPVSHESAVPPGVAAAFAANALAANAVFWVLIGVFLSFTLNRFAQDSIPS
ncbi:MAG: CbtA family protein [Aestuariivirga sp.]